MKSLKQHSQIVFFLFLCVGTVFGNADRKISSPGESQILNEIKVTFLNAKRISESERKTDDGLSQDGVKFVWLVENAPEVAIPAVLGEIKVSFENKLYNEVINASSSKPFAPDFTIYDIGNFPEKKIYEKLFPKARPDTKSVILEAVVRGKQIPDTLQGIVKIELGTVDKKLSPEKQLTTSEVKMAKFTFSFCLQR